jgi:anti-sigma-K factor RskA
VTSCNQFREQFEAYALGALDTEERVPLEAHLVAGCKDCAKAVEEARWVVSQLGCLAPEAAPPDLLKGRLMHSVRAEAENAKHFGPTKSRIPFWMKPGIAALLVFSLYSTIQMYVDEDQKRLLSHLAQESSQRENKLTRELHLAKQEALVLSDPDSVKIALASQDHQAPPLEAKWHPHLGIVLSGQRVPIPSGDRVLQLWLIPKAPGGKPIPSLTLRPDPHGNVVLLVANPPEMMAETKALAVTEEPAGGSPQPTTAPRWVGGVG